MIMMTFDGMKEIRVGMCVGFKDDVEQYGRVTKLSVPLTIETTDHRSGEKIEKRIPSQSVWVEE